MSISPAMEVISSDEESEHTEFTLELINELGGTKV